MHELGSGNWLFAMLDVIFTQSLECLNCLIDAPPLVRINTQGNVRTNYLPDPFHSLYVGLAIATQFHLDGGITLLFYLQRIRRHLFRITDTYRIIRRDGFIIISTEDRKSVV